MTFKIDQFTLNCTFGKLDRCTKADLLLVVNLLNNTVPLNARKVEIKRCFSEKWVKRGILPQVKPKTASEGLHAEVGAQAATAAQSPSG